MADCRWDQRKKQTRPEKKAEPEHEWKNHKENQRRWCRAATTKNGNVWQNTEPMKLHGKQKVPASDKHYWLASFGKHHCFLLSNFKLSTSSFTHHPCVTKARAALHVHVRTLTQLHVATRGFWVYLHLVMNLRCSGILINQYPLPGTMSLEYLLVDPNNDFRSSRTVGYCHYKYTHCFR